jgi:hypothetical protein
MSQSLYDAQHGMSPEELWARYRQYPWANNVGDMVMQGEPDYWQGPGLPKNVLNVPLPQGYHGGTVAHPLLKDRVFATMINSNEPLSDRLKAINHEFTHSTQIKEGLPPGGDGTKQPDYYNLPGEVQARLVANLSKSQNIANPLDDTSDTGVVYKNDSLRQRVAPSLMELLMQGREQYYPPFISQGMQK